MSFLSDWLQSPADEYICLSELPIGNGKVDFVVLTSRSRMLVYLIEIKGANFNIINKNHYKDMNVNIHNAVKQISNHIKYIDENYEVFRKYIHNIRQEVIDGKYKPNHLLGPKGYLEVDPDKDISIATIVIGEKTVNDHFESSERTKFEKGYNSYSLKVCSWNSFLNRIDKNHGHYF